MMRIEFDGIELSQRHVDIINASEFNMEYVTVKSCYMEGLHIATTNPYLRMFDNYIVNCDVVKDLYSQCDYGNIIIGRGMRQVKTVLGYYSPVISR